MNVNTSSAMFLPSEIIESVLLEKLANRNYSERPVIQFDLFGHDDRELDRLHDRHVNELGNYLIYG